MVPPSESVAASERAPILWAREPRRLEIIRRARADVVVLYGYRAASFWMAWAAARVSRASVVWTTDATTLDQRDRRSWKAWSRGLVLPGSSGREMRPSFHRVGGGGSCSRLASLPIVSTSLRTSSTMASSPVVPT